jgi:hypothetical protein
MTCGVLSEFVDGAQRKGGRQVSGEWSSMMLEFIDGAQYKGGRQVLGER